MGVSVSPYVPQAYLRRQFNYSYQSSPTEGHIWKWLNNIIDLFPLDLYLYMRISYESYKNKYAIYAYTHGPVTGSGPSVVPSTVVELRVPPSLLPYSANVNLTAAYRRWPWEKLNNVI